MAGAYDHSLAVKADGSAAGWGYWTSSNPLPAGTDYTAVATGYRHGLFLKGDGSIVGWGSTPPAGNDYVAIAAGSAHSLALKADGSIVGWGDNTSGQATPPAGNDYVAIAAGTTHSLALKADGSIVGWGDNTSGQATPPAGNDYVAIAAGSGDGPGHSLALKADGSIVGWGPNGSGQATPPPGNDYVAIAAGGGHSLALKLNQSPVGDGFSATVPDDVAVGTALGTVTGSDPDGDPVRFAIAAGNELGLFTVSTMTGEMVTSGPLDSGPATTHVLTVTVSDGMLADTTTVIVNVTTSDDGPPPDDDDLPPWATFEDVPFDHTFYADIEWLARQGITRGCNPPDNTRYCPSDPVARGQMAAFLNRAPIPGLDPSGPAAPFTDTAASVFVDDIDWLYRTGVTKGCTDTLFCPTDPVTRGQMAAFLVRALGLTDDGGGNTFTDDDGSVFEDDIAKLAAAGITKGCNPPTNDRFCPTDPVTRGQMAAFLRRALD